ncbi:MAG: sensor histidine kinase [Frankia sp.]
MDATSRAARASHFVRGLGPARVDVLTAVVAVVVLTFGSRGAARGQLTSRPLDWFAFTLLVAGAVVLAARRAAPIPVLALEVALVAVYSVRDYPYGPILFAVLLPAYTVGATQGRRATLTAIVLGGTTITVANVIGADPRAMTEWAGSLGHFGWVLVPAVVGLLVRNTRLAGARADAEAERRRAEHARLQVAREVHDVVGHGLSVISLQAGVALHVLDRRPEQAQVALEAIRRTSIEALAELRETLALTGKAPRDPLTGLGRVSGLVSDVRLCGLPVEVVTVGRERPLPAEVDLAAFRVVREALTNVLRHAGPASARVSLSYEPEALVIEVANTPPRPAPEAPGPSGAYAATTSPGGGLAGRGLAGLRVRVGDLGGSMYAGPAAGGGWTVRATIPTASEDGQSGEAEPVVTTEPAASEQKAESAPATGPASVRP